MINSARTGKQGGFTIVELMVGIVVGLLVVLAATAGASFYEANRRNTIGGNGAQENATATAYFIQREARMAGMWSGPAAFCPTGKAKKYNSTTSSYDTVTLDPTSGGTPFETPLSIAAGTGTNNTDSMALTFSYASELGGMPDGVLDHDKNGADFSVSVKTGKVVGDYFHKHDLVLLSPPSSNTTTDCVFGVITQVQNSASHLQMRPYGNSNGQPSDPVFDGFATGSRILNLGAIPISRTLRLNNNNVEIVFAFPDYNASSNPCPAGFSYLLESSISYCRSVVAENVVKLIARFSNNTGDGTSPANWVQNTTSNRLQVILVGRSSQREKPSSGNAADACDATTSANLPKDWNGNNITVQNSSDTSRADGTWQCFRYRTVQLDLPLKNLILQAAN